MKHLTVIATIKAKPGRSDELKRELLQLIAPTRQEDGCINYDLHQDSEDPSTFVFYENWTSLAALEKHLQSPHILSYLEKEEQLLADWSLQKLVKLM
jgi:quinol monooxygenase YgiN